MSKEMLKAVNHLESEISDLSRVIDDAGTYMKDVEDAFKKLRSFQLLDDNVDPELPSDKECINFYVRDDSETDQSIIVVYGEFKNRRNRITSIDLSIHTNGESAEGERRSFEGLSFEKARDLVLEAIGQQASNNAVGVE